ncbi:Endonuclease/exonuclease/phosphatase, partial [Mycena crocata]
EKKNTKASIKVAGLNIRGNGSTDVYNPKNKWYEVWQTMWRQKVAVLVVGEAHMDDQRKVDIESLYARCIRLEFTKDPQTANAKGVALVLNKNMIKTNAIRTREMIPGRVIVLEMTNVDGKPFSVLGIYAPNPPGENAVFWKEIQTWFERHRNIRRPDIMVGDTNIVESEIDRLPVHPDNEAAVNALDDLKTYLRLVDGWRETYPTTREYTYHEAESQGGAMSRIDRIYIRHDIFEQSFEWEIQTIGIETDHRMVSTRITTEDAPTIGHGRWVWPAHLMRDEKLNEFIHRKGLILERDLKQATALSPRDPKFNPQTLWARYKQSIGDKARERAKIIVPIMDRDIAVLKNKLDTVLADPELSEEERKLAGVVLLEKLEAIERYRQKTTRTATQIRNRMEGEVIGKYWTMLN